MADHIIDPILEAAGRGAWSEEGEHVCADPSRHANSMDDFYIIVCRRTIDSPKGEIKIGNKRLIDWSSSTVPEFRNLDDHWRWYLSVVLQHELIHLILHCESCLLARWLLP